MKKLFLFISLVSLNPIFAMNHGKQLGRVLEWTEEEKAEFAKLDNPKPLFDSESEIEDLPLFRSEIEPLKEKQDRLEQEQFIAALKAKLSTYTHVRHFGNKIALTAVAGFASYGLYSLVFQRNSSRATSLFYIASGIEVARRIGLRGLRRKVMTMNESVGHLRKNMGAGIRWHAPYEKNINKLSDKIICELTKLNKLI